MKPEVAQALNLPLIDKVEVINSISSLSAGNHTKNSLRVVVLNIERGRRALTWIDILKKLDPDLVLLNEADFGIARLDNQHVARNLASMLSMNYAWGIEFIELTKGTKSEQAWTDGVEDMKYLHGNAILSNYALSEPEIFRDKIGDYFSHDANGKNAGGYERRLGGRMGLMAKMKGFKGGDIVVGNVHKVGTQDLQISNYVGSNYAIIGGDQGSKSCEHWGLHLDSNVSTPTWPASCESLGKGRGDIICTNMKHTGEEHFMLPCKRDNGISIPLGDHAYVVQDFIIEQSNGKRH